MKKTANILCVLLVVVLLVTITACGGTSTSVSSSTAAGNTGGAAASTESNAASSEAGGGEIDWDTYDATGTVVEWNWNQMMIDNMTEVYAERFPNVKYEPLVVNSDDILSKLQTGLASGTDTPDILLGNQDWRGSLYELGIYEDLQAAPYNYDTSKIMDTVLPQLIDANGTFVAFDQQFAPAAFAYRRDLTEKYFGVSEPDDVAEYISTWDKFVAAGEKLASQTSDVSMMAGFMDLAETMMMQGSHKGWTDLATNTVDITGRFGEGWKKAFDIAAKVPLGKTTVGSTEWHSTYNQGTVIFYNMTSWTSRSYVAGNFPESKDQSLWGVCKAPGEVTGFKGGTSIGICKQSKNKESTYAMIYYLYSTVDGANTMFKRLGYVPAIKEFYEGDSAAILQGGFYDNYYAGQNIALYLYQKVMPLAKTDQYDQLYVPAKSVYNAVAAQAVADSSIDADAVIQLMKDGVAAKVPGVNVK